MYIGKKIWAVLWPVVILFGISFSSSAQLVSGEKFGKGINFISQDSSFTSKIGFRFQTLFTAEPTLNNSKIDGLETNMLIRRTRLKFDGYAFNPNVVYKVELALSNRDFGTPITENGLTPNLVLDAVLKYRFHNNFTLWLGQTKLPSNRERVISSQKLQQVDRSLLNKYFTLDRDIGVQLRHKATLGNNFLVENIFSISNGEGRNLTKGNFGGLDYTYRLELLPFGKFAGKGDYVGGAVELEDKHKLAIGFTYDYNESTPRSAGQLGSFILDSLGNYVNANIQSTFIDWMYKYKRFSFMGELAQKSSTVADDNAFYESKFFSGSGINQSVGYMFTDKWEVSGRYTYVDRTHSTNLTMYTLGFSKYIVKHNLKFQTDFSLTDEEGEIEPLIRFQCEMAF
ncbi:MAG: hypothetical protein KDC92_10930 [Bacteroidetes bacterium]|nr:hypothetical protein [Bacteroidota bacterium]